jgi:hypothetical protein
MVNSTTRTTWRISIAIAIAAAGCGSKKDGGGASASGSSGASAVSAPAPAPTAAPAPTPAPTAPPAPAPAPAACPEAKPLGALLAKSFAVSADAVGDAVCAPGRFPKPGFVVYTTLPDPGDSTNSFSRLAVVSSDGALIAKLDGAPDKDRLASTDSIDALAVADLDGDGVDEIVATKSSAYKYSPTTAGVAVFQVSGSSVKQLLYRGFAFTSADDPEGNEGTEVCSGKFEVASSTLVVTGRVTGPIAKFAKDKPECVDGREVYALRAGAMTKQ